MSKFLSILTLIFTLFVLTLNSAEAARFGGGRSFGAQRSISSYSRYQQPLRPSAPIAQGAGASRWLAPLAGLAAGSLLGYLMMGHGMGSGLLTWFAIFAIGSLLFNMLRQKRQQPSADARYQQVNDPNHGYHNNVHSFPNSANSSKLPNNFNSDIFLRDCKVQFIRLQASYDSKNLSDIREFTTSEVFAEVQLQIQERGDKVNQTEVVSLEAELLDLSEEQPSAMASVKFSGMIREDVGEAAHAFSETWHFRKDLLSQQWLVAGVQQG